MVGWGRRKLLQFLRDGWVGYEEVTAVFEGWLSGI